MKNKDSLIGPFACIIAVIIIGIVLAIVLKPNDNDPENSPAPTKSNSLYIDIETIEYEIKNIGKLCTAEYNFTASDTYGKDKLKVWFISVPWTESKEVIQYSGSIKAGIDFENVDVELDENNKTVNITLPEVIIISQELDYESFKVLDEKEGLFNKLTLEDRNAATKELLAKEVCEAEEKGLLNDARENSETIMHTMYDGVCTAAGYKLNLILQ